MLFTVDCPAGHVVTKTFGMVEATTVITMSQRGAWARFTEGDTPDHKDAIDNLKAMLPRGANAIVGVRVSTCSTADGNCNLLLAMTYVGTPVLVVADKNRESPTEAGSRSEAIVDGEDCATVAQRGPVSDR